MAADPKETLLDEILPSFDYRTMHGRPVDASPERVAAAIHETDFGEAKVARTLLAVRTFGRSLRRPGSRIADAGDGAGFLPLVKGDAEVVVGFVGRPWPGGESGPAVTADGFGAFEPTDSVKVAMSLRCVAAGYGTLLLTETRILVGPDAKKPFGRYWRVIRLGSDAVRQSLLRAIARHAEASPE